MSVVSFIANRWAQSGYLTRTAAVVYAAPIAVWGVCTAEAAIRCALRLLHTGATFDSKTRLDRWEITKDEGARVYAGGLLTGVSLFPIIGTYKSYQAMRELVSQHIADSWELQDLQQRANAHAADTLFQELNGWEPDLDKIITDAVDKPKPTQILIDATASNLRGSLIGSNWVFTSFYYTIDACCRVVKIVAYRIARIVAALFEGRILRFIAHSFTVIKDAVKKQIQYTCNLIEQPNRTDVSEKPVPEIYRDIIQSFLEKCEPAETRERVRVNIARLLPYRQYATTNTLARLNTDGPLPNGAPDNYLHTLRYLPIACAHYSRVKAYLSDQELQIKKAELVKHFKLILPFIETFEAAYTANTSGAARQEVLWELTKLMPNLREITLDMNGVDPRWQMLIAVQLAKFSPQLAQVTFTNAHPRTIQIMRRFCSWFCRVT